MSDIHKGDSVRLKSGGPLMTVENIGKQQYRDDEFAWCVWFEKTVSKRDTFPLFALLKES